MRIDIPSAISYVLPEHTSEGINARQVADIDRHNDDNDVLLNEATYDCERCGHEDGMLRATKVTKTLDKDSGNWLETGETLTSLCPDCVMMRWDRDHVRYETRDELKRAAAYELGIRVSEPGITKPPPCGDMLDEVGQRGPNKTGIEPMFDLFRGSFQFARVRTLFRTTPFLSLYCQDYSFRGCSTSDKVEDLWYWSQDYDLMLKWVRCYYPGLPTYDPEQFARYKELCTVGITYEELAKEMI